MVRDDDFGEVPNLGPAQDALDKPPRPATRPQASPQTSRPSSSTENPAKRSGNGFVYLLLLLIVFSIVGLGYLGWQHTRALQQQLATLSQQQATAAQKIAALENLISATDENANKSGAALQAQLRQLLNDRKARLAHVDSEIAKLWTVAHQRNRPKIEALEKSTAEVEAAIEKVEKKLASEVARLDQLKKQLAASDKVLVNTGSALNELTSNQALMREQAQQLARQMQIRDQANQELDELQDAQLKRLMAQLQQLQDNPTAPASLTAQVQEYGRAIDSINAFRKQINQELLRLRDRVNTLQLSAPAKPGA